MKMRRKQNKDRSKHNKNENWMSAKLKTTGLKWTRQAQWGYRIFDFWNSYLGIAVEVDGPEHNQEYDKFRDDYNFNRSGIEVLRVRNGNELDAENIIGIIRTSQTWIERRKMLGILTSAEKRRL